MEESLMSWLSAFFRQDKVQMFLRAALSLLKILLGGVADSLNTIAQEEVKKAELSGKSGQEKYEAAFKGIKVRLPELRDSAINLAIELAVSALQVDK